MVIEALEEQVSELAVRLLAEPSKIRWTGELIALAEDARVIGARARFVGGDGALWALVAADDAAGSRLERYAERAPLRWLRVGDGIPSGGIPVGRWAERCPELVAIAEVYGERRARRSGVRLIRHVHEGIAVLRALGASELAIRGFCVHPLVQADAELAATWAQGRLVGLDPRAVALAVEYRAVANAFLSAMEDHPGYRDPAAIRRSPLAEVQAMLVADKIQNAKDFERFHRDSHPRAEWLGRYFDRWLEALGVSAEQRVALTAEISLPKACWRAPEPIED